MNIDEPEFSEPLAGESPEDFLARIRLARRVVPTLRELLEQRVALVIESDRRTSEAVSHSSDFVLELGDTRLRLLLAPEDPAPFQSQKVTRDSLAHYLLDVPDTDAVAVVADDETMSTWIYDVYALQSPAPVEPSPLGEALGAYFEASVHPIEIPNFRGLLALPSRDQLRSALERNARANLESVTASRARIPEKVTALEQVGPGDSRRLVEMLVFALDGGVDPLTVLFPDMRDSDDD